MSKKTNTYLFYGCLLLYFAFKGDFWVWYNGIALIAGITAFIYAFLEYRKKDH